MLNSNTCNHFTAGKKWLILNRIISVRYKWLKPFNCVEIIAIPVCKQIRSNTFKNEIIYKQLIAKEIFVLDRNSWNHLTVGQKMRSDSFKNVIYKMCLQIEHSI